MDLAESEVILCVLFWVSPVSKDGFAVKKILTFVALVGFITVLGCNDAKTSSSSTKTTTTETKTAPKDGK
jgi:hypothetical protein